MPQPSRARRPPAAGTTKKAVLPPIGVARFREALLVLEQVVAANVQTFIGHGQEYRDQHREVTSRPLTAEEVTTIANGLGADLAEAKRQLADANLKAYDEPQGPEILMAGVAGASPVMLDAVIRLTALVEMPAAEFRAAREAGTLAGALDEAVKRFDDEEFSALRERAGVAWGHLAEAMGYQSGKALTLIAKTMWQTISQAMVQLTPAALSSIASQTDTAGPAETSSTTSPG